MHMRTKEGEREGRATEISSYNKSISTILKYQPFGEKKAGAMIDLWSVIIMCISFIFQGWSDVEGVLERADIKMNPATECGVLIKAINAEVIF